MSSRRYFLENVTVLYVFTMSSGGCDVCTCGGGSLVLLMLQAHRDAVLALAFSSRRLITCSRDRTIRICDIRSGTLIHTLSGHKVQHERVVTRALVPVHVHSCAHACMCNE